MKRPEECASLQDIRDAIDLLDQQMVALLAQRAIYVKAASHYKTSPMSVKAPERLALMIESRRLWAREQQLDADFIEQLFAHITNYFISQEMGFWREREEREE
ncbi:isochorismate-pyruvate lyase [Ktedonosporobacter rubrisoli]|uniref:Isochorismate-pyruvate lyase n=1 Tax=Ktedonosporobacter rubrisoli TaxID=2509675 RepID=A0A4P6K472_KTERU|nr:chorismate mutase [Ktedonosporobacter rubrisoli]QBD82855.1 isochorismate-pyruvate lyase [Ktedonosporobacter rubrisoli]